jgi:hypothetical protein
MSHRHAHINPSLLPNPGAHESRWDISLHRALSGLMADIKISLDELSTATGGGVADGDKGDISVTVGGTVWTIDNDVVTYAKMQNVSATSRILGRITAGAGDVEELTGANVRTITGLATTDSPELASINIGHASDTTLSRNAAGILALEGVPFTFADAGFDVLYGWDDSVGRAKNMLLADIATEAAPAAGDFFVIMGAEGDLRKVNWSSLPAGGIANVVEDTSPTLGGNLEGGGFSLGTSGSQASDVFLEEGGVINFDNGDYTITQSGDDLFLNRGSNQGQAVGMHWVKLTSGNNLSNSTTTQPLFDGGGGSANGALTLETGQYFFECMLHITSMSIVSGNGEFEPLGAGTATMTQVLFHAVGIDSGTPLAAATQTGSGGTSGTANAASVVTAGTGNALLVSIRGTFNITVAGTIIPSIDLVTGALAVVETGSYFKCWRAGGTGVATIGAWS